MHRSIVNRRNRTREIPVLDPVDPVYRAVFPAAVFPAAVVAVVGFVVVGAIGAEAFAAPSRAKPTTHARVVSQQGRRVQVRADAGRFAPGMPVWISEKGNGTRGGLPVCEGRVLYVHRQRAVIEIPADAPAVPKNAIVEPRYVAEARLYGGSFAPRDRPRVVKPTKPMPWRTWHTAPSSVAWNGKLWLEIVGTPNIDNVIVRWRLGGAGPFADKAMKRGHDGMWTAELALGATRPAIRKLQYYIVGEVRGAPAAGKTAVSGGENTALSGHPSRPHRVTITSVPTRRRTRMVAHDPPGRVTHRRALVLTAQVNPRFAAPIVYYRPRGGGSFDAIAMRPVSKGVYKATIPAKHVVVPGLSYYIAVRDDKGVTRDGFANRRYPRHVSVTRGAILSPESRRNTLLVRGSTVDYGGDGDAWRSLSLGLRRRFFGFMVARLGGEVLTGSSPRLTTLNGVSQTDIKPLDLYAGSAGLQVHIGNYISVHSDLVLGIHNDGAAAGYEVGTRIGDEAGAQLTASWRSMSDVDTDASIIRRFRASLSAPVLSRLRIAGAVIHEDILQDQSEGLRLQLEATTRLAGLALTGHAGIAGRDADRINATAGLGVGFSF